MLEPSSANKPCVHHWLVDTARGPISLGTCKRCGVVAEFSNEFLVPFPSLPLKPRNGQRLKDRREAPSNS